MLDRILNITPGSDYNQSPFKKHKREFLLPGRLNIHGAHDTLTFSPAFLFISQLNWQIYGLKLLKDDKLSINFALNNIEFHTEVDLNNFNSSYPFTFTMLQKKNFAELERYTLITLERKYFDTPQGNTIFEYKHLARLFDHIWNLNLNNELNDEECYLNTLLEEIYHQVDSEISFITDCIVTFVEKLFNTSFSHMLQVDNPAPLLKIKKIKSFNA